MEIQVAQDLKRPTLEKKRIFLSCSKKTENFGLSPDKQSASKALKYFAE
jgi:hypothetical protein